MRILLFIITLVITSPAIAQVKTIAKPVYCTKLQPNELTPEQVQICKRPVVIPLTAAERQAEQQERLKFQQEKPMRDWEEMMDEATKEMSDHLESVIDVLTQEQKDALPPPTVEAYEYKKQVRSAYPGN